MLDLDSDHAGTAVCSTDFSHAFGVICTQLLQAVLQPSLAGTGFGETTAIAKMAAYASMFQNLLSKQSIRAKRPITVDDVHLHPVTWIPQLGVFQNANLTAGCPR